MVLPAPLGPMMALIEPVGLEAHTVHRLEAVEALRTSRTSSMRALLRMRRLPISATAPATPAGEDEEQGDEDGAEDERPVLGVGHDLLVQPQQHEGAEGGAEEAPMPPSSVMIRTSDDLVQ